MKFAAPSWLFGTGIALVVLALLIAGAFSLLRALRRFGDEKLVNGLVTGRPGGRRAFKGALVVLAVALAFVALAQPQYGHGTRVIPATNLDVVVVLDYSKSMYARDIAPSRTLRAKSEVSSLIAELPGARFGAVAFAGRPIAFPLTSDGGAISQFFRQMSPNDMPEGGTAIGRALEAARELFARDPLSEKHEKVCLLVTDGEDLEGDPVAAAEALAQNGVRVFVVQVGGRTPEPIPNVNEIGQVTGYRQGVDGRPLTTELSAEGEAQLAKIAEVSGGSIVRSGDGKTGIDVIASKLRQLMTEELSERVETVYADVFYYPLTLALLLIVLETFVNETRTRARSPELPPPPSRRKKSKRREFLTTASTLALALNLLGCESFERSPFTRNAPSVDKAIAALEAGNPASAAELLTQYLATGKCENGAIGTPDRVRDYPDASFDLGLALFGLAESHGRRFGEEPPPSEGKEGEGSPEDPEALAKRSSEVDCALRVVRVVAGQSALPAELRARAWFLAGNLEFLRSEYRNAVASYDNALRVTPGTSAEKADRIGRDAAHNRAIALRRIQEEEEKQKDQKDKDQNQDQNGEQDPNQEQKQDKKDDAGDQSQDQDQNAQKQPEPDADPNDQGQNAQKPPDQGAGDGQDDPPQQDPNTKVPQPEQRAQDNQRMLDELEQAPTFQEHDAKNQARARARIRMEDK